MQLLAPRKIDETQITVTNTATLLYALMDTANVAAGGTVGAAKYYDGRLGGFGANGIIIRPVANIRVSVGTPTASKGFLLEAGNSYYLPRIPLSSLNLISVSGSNVSVDVQPVMSTEGEAGWVATADTVSVVGSENLSQVGGTSVVSGVTTPSAITAGEQNVLADAVYNSSPPSPTNGQRVNLQSNASGALNVDETLAPQAEDNTNGVYAEAIKPLAVSTYSWTLFQNLGANATLNVKATAGSIKSIYCHNLGAAPAYIQIHKTATVPTNGNVPALSFLIPAGGVILIDGQFLGENGYFCTTGIAFAYSTTEATYTAGTAGNQVTQIMYV